MQRYEYKVVPAPRKAVKVRGAKTTEDRFAVMLEELMNQLGAQGWDYVRSDTLPVEERQGLTGRATTYQSMLIFRRAVESAMTQPTAVPATAAPAPVPPAPAAEPVAAQPSPQPLAAQARVGAPSAGRDPFSVPAPLVLNDPTPRAAPTVGPAIPPRDIG